MKKLVLKIIPAIRRVLICGTLFAITMIGCKNELGNDGKGEGMLKINGQDHHPITECSIISGTDSSSDNYLNFQNKGVNQLVVEINPNELVSKTYTGLDGEIVANALILDDIVFDRDNFVNEDDFIMKVNKSGKTYDIIISGNYYNVSMGTEENSKVAYIYKHTYELTYKGTIRAESGNFILPRCVLGKELVE